VVSFLYWGICPPFLLLNITIRSSPVCLRKKNQQGYMKEASRPMIAYDCQDIFDFDESSLNMDSKRMQCKNDLPFSVDMSVKKIDADNATSNGNICEGPMLDANGEISFNSGSNNKRQRKNNLPSDVDMSCKQIFDDNVASAERRSIPVHRSNKVDVEEKEKNYIHG
jgi:hypothetical protein